MKIAIIGANGMLSVALTKQFMEDGHYVDVFGLDAPNGYECSNYYPCNLLDKDGLNYGVLMQSEMIVYASGAGVQAAISTPSSLTYALNVNAPIEITLQLKKRDYKGIYVSFGSYMEIGLNDEEGRAFTEEEVVCSVLSVTNDYALSKRLYGRYMMDFTADFVHWHFILPNMFSSDDFKHGTRLIPYCLKYIQEVRKGQDVETPKFSSGTQTRQFIMLDEVEKVVLKSVESHLPSGIYNIGGGEFYTIRELIERIFRYYDIPIFNEYFGASVRRDGDVKSLRINGNRLSEAIGWLPSAKIEDALCKFGL